MGAYTLSPPQRGHLTRRTNASLVVGKESLDITWVEKCTLGSAAQRQLESRVLGAGVQATIGLKAHEAHRHHESVAADFGNHAALRIDAHAQQLKGPPLG